MFGGLIRHRKEVLLAVTVILSLPVIFALLADVGGMGAQAVYLALLGIMCGSDCRCLCFEALVTLDHGFGSGTRSILCRRI